MRGATGEKNQKKRTTTKIGGKIYINLAETGRAPEAGGALGRSWGR